jgi:hypothetical protein
VNVLRTRAYISLDSALREYGISTQSPRVLTCVTVERPYEFRGECIAITDRGISPRLHWGYQEKKSRYPSYQIAEPDRRCSIGFTSSFRTEWNRRSMNSISAASIAQDWWNMRNAFLERC